MIHAASAFCAAPRFQLNRVFLFFWISIGIALAAIIIMAVVVLRHWQEIKIIDPNSIQEEREKQKRDELILQRFDRLRSEKTAPLKAVYNKVAIAAKKRFHAAYLHLVRLEKYYKQAKAPFALMTPSVKDRIKLLLNDARSLARDLKWADAERRYIEVLGIDAHSWDAYRGLGTLYLKQELYPQAKETFEFILHSKKANDATFAALADIAEHEQDMVTAEDFRKKAIAFHPRLANRHAELAQFYLEREEIEKAWDSAKRATELDSKSAKYLELSLEAAILLGDRHEARRRYDSLRLVSQDRPKLDAIKARLEAMPM